ncbi:MAG: S8 family serine peptidase [Bdellovibrionales bacterium]|nr:S8 family serine peptidase [Bdellovibrionales bacterium]
MKHLLLLTLLLLKTDFFEMPVYTYYVEFQTSPTATDIASISSTYDVISFEKFYKKNGEFWNRYYEVTSNDSKLDSQLLKNSLFARVEKPISATPLSLEPSSPQSPVSSDTFINYQWALQNNGQKLFRATDDIHPEIITSKSGFDVQWAALQTLLAQKTDLKRPVVAVIDSGLSYTHDEITHALYKNDIECKNGMRIDGTDEDKDNNGFAGDCLGWNFATKNKRRRNDVFDDIGHGTHISGIIAAKTDNKGISGLWDQIQILPLKVYSNSQESDMDPFIQGVAKAILYAIDRKVDVINLSMGWPLVSDIPAVRNALREALDANITIVAGAGNDGHSAKVLPCSYEGVICVGATSLDGGLPGFTNYGGQVDLMAPGEAILSILPPLLSSKQFGLRKFDIMNGTSQSTPYVSAAAAVLKSYYPKITNDEILARLRISAKSEELNWGDKFAGSGLLQTADAVLLKKQSYVAPVLKDLSLFLVDLRNKRVNLELPIKNYWSATRNIHVEVNSDDLILTNKSFSISSLGTGETKSLQITAELPNTNSDYTATLNIAVSVDGQTKNFKHTGFFASDVNQVNFKDLSVDATQTLQSVNDYDVAMANAEFFYTEKTDAGLNIQLLRVDESRVFKAAGVNLPNAVALYPYIGVTRIDLDYDGTLDYFITAIIQNGESSHIEHYSFDTNLKPLLGKYSSWKFEDEGILIQQTSLGFAKFQSKELGTIRIPVFLGEKIVPSLDQNPDPFELQVLNGRGLYALQPVVVNGEVQLKTRLLNNYKRLEQLSEKLSLRFNEDIRILYYDLKSENIRVILSAGLGVNLKYYTAEYSATDFKLLHLDELSIGNIDLRYQVSRKINESTVAFFGIFRNNLAQLTLYDLESKTSKAYEIESDSIKNGVVSLYAVNIKDDVVEAFVETVDSLYLFSFSKGGGLAKQAKPIYRFSYFPGKFFTDLLFPLHLSTESTAIYVDSSFINGGNVHLWLSDLGKLSAPIKYSLQLPKACIALNPRKLYASDSAPSYLFLCKEHDALRLRQIPL